MQKKKVSSPKSGETEPSTTARNTFLILLSTAFIAGGIYFGIVFFASLSELSNVISSIAQSPLDLAINIAAGSDSVATSKGPPKVRTSILLLGLDRRPEEGDAPSRSDSMNIVTIDPITNTVGMLGIPRDLWVPIPLGNGKDFEQRINTAYVWGELNKYPGGGPALAVKTVEYNLGVKIDHYIVTDFQGFKRMVDTVGGIDITVEKTLEDWEYPTDNYKTIRIRIPAGEQHFDGERALQYARSRHQDSDMGRIKRQQQVMVAVAKKALQLGMVPKLPQLWREFNNYIKTDMSLGEMAALAKLLKDSDQNNIVSRVIDYPQLAPMTTADGAAVLLPVRDKVGELVREVFYDPHLRQEAATVEVLNGTGRSSLAANTADFLKKNGFSQVSYGNATDGLTGEQTTIVDFRGKGYSASRIADLLKLPSSRVSSQPDPASLVDVRVILGSDAANLKFQ